MLFGESAPAVVIILGSVATAVTLGTPSLATSCSALAALEPAAAGCKIVYCLFTSSEAFSTSLTALALSSELTGYPTNVASAGKGPKFEYVY